MRRDKAIELRKTLEKVLKMHPDADPDNVWHTLLLLEMNPLQRLEFALRRSQKIKSRSGAKPKRPKSTRKKT